MHSGGYQVYDSYLGIEQVILAQVANSLPRHIERQKQANKLTKTTTTTTINSLLWLILDSNVKAFGLWEQIRVPAMKEPMQT